MCVLYELVSYLTSNILCRVLDSHVRAGYGYPHNNLIICVSPGIVHYDIKLNMLCANIAISEVHSTPVHCYLY